MRVAIKYLSRSAVIYDRLFRRVAMQLRAGGKTDTLVQGYLVRAINSGVSTTVHVVDAPAQLVLSGPAVQDGKIEVARALVVGDRDAYSAAPTTPDLPTPPSARRNMVLTGYSALGSVPPGEGRLVQPYGSQPFGEYAFALSRVATVVGSTVVGAYLDLVGLSWGTTARRVDDPAPGARPSPATERRLRITDSGLQFLYARPGLLLYPPVGARGHVVDGFRFACVSTYEFLVAIPASDLVDPADEKLPVLVLRVRTPLFDPEVRVQQAQAVWSATIEDQSDYPRQTPWATYNLGVAYGSVGATVVRSRAARVYPNPAPDTTFRVEYRAERYVFNEVGALVGTTLLASVDYDGFPQSVPLGTFLDYFAPVDDMVTTVQVDAECVAGVGWRVLPQARLALVGPQAVVVSDMHTLGWQVWRPVMRGAYNIDFGPNVQPAFGRVSRTLIRIGADLLACVACTEQAAAAASVIEWHLIVLDNQLRFVEARGVVAEVPYTPATGKMLSLSLVTPEVTTPAGTTKAVLLVAVAPGNLVRLSVDGGSSWRTLAERAVGDPYYIGNKLHRVTIGESL